ncbi:MAG: neutral zinc metallopeptidase [Polyangiaceae bacterium]
MRFDDPSDDSTANVEDRRGEGRSYGGGGGGGGGIRLGLGGFVLLGVLSLVFRQNFFALLGRGRRRLVRLRARRRARRPARAPRAKRGSRRSRCARSTTRSGSSAKSDRSRAYADASLVLLGRDALGCGAADAEMGPFYCPADEKVYIDLGFYDEPARRFKAPGDFAQAYVMAHEMGHHVQGVMGIEGKMRREQRASPSRKNELSVRLELQADCFAGAWGHSASQRGLLERGDVEEGLTAAASVGDDRIQKMAGRRVSPESFTHGSAAMRTKWFKRGFDSGRFEDCDTFAASSL